MKCWRRQVLAQANFSIQENKEARIGFLGNAIERSAERLRFAYLLKQAGVGWLPDDADWLSGGSPTMWLA